MLTVCVVCSADTVEYVDRLVGKGTVQSHGGYVRRPVMGRE